MSIKEKIINFLGGYTWQQAKDYFGKTRSNEEKGETMTKISEEAIVIAGLIEGGSIEVSGDYNLDIKTKVGDAHLSYEKGSFSIKIPDNLVEILKNITKEANND